MNRNMDVLTELNDLVTTSFRRKHIIVLEPEESGNEEKLNASTIYDKAQWRIPQEIRPLIDKLSQDTQLSKEEKILAIYEKLCGIYIYDDNLISYIQKIDDDSFSLPDWYGRDVDQEWEKNREQHKRRVCYEVSRYLAKSLMDLFQDDEDISVCILWDKGLTHYFVGLTCSEYSVTLDLDDFNNIKDLTRLKTGLTAEGIAILDDPEGKFKSALDRFNQNRSRDAIKKVEDEIGEDTCALGQNTENQTTPSIEELDDIIFLRNAIEILREKYHIDEQGLYEYMKEIVDIKLGPQARKKVWKEIKGNNDEEKRYIRCLVLDVDNQKYIIDVERMLLRAFDEEELKREDREFIPYKELTSEQLIKYRSLKEGRYNGG